MKLEYNSKQMERRRFALKSIAGVIAEVFVSEISFQNKLKNSGLTKKDLEKFSTNLNIFLSNYMFQHQLLTNSGHFCNNETLHLFMIGAQLKANNIPQNFINSFDIKWEIQKDNSSYEVSGVVNARKINKQHKAVNTISINDLKLTR
ncbi:MAG: hypothetical protein J6C13_00710 [Clostridia bacterium]|nr:hypothetical protein [Clostridia bacterium]